MNKEEFDKRNVFGLGNPNDAYAAYFNGKSFLNPLTNPKDAAVFLANVTFEPGCRNNWHGATKSSWFSHIAVVVPVRTQEMNG